MTTPIIRTRRPPSSDKTAQAHPPGRRRPRPDGQLAAAIRATADAAVRRPSRTERATVTLSGPVARTLTLDAIAERYQISRRSVQRRLRALENAGLIRPATAGGGRGNPTTYDVADVRRHFRARPPAPPTPPPAAGAEEDPDWMEEPDSYGTWVRKCAEYRRWQERRAKRERDAAAASTPTAAPARHEPGEEGARGQAST